MVVSGKTVLSRMPFSSDDKAVVPVPEGGIIFPERIDPGKKQELMIAGRIRSLPGDGFRGEMKMGEVTGPGFA
jgi:hypothetical protein